MNPIGTNFTSPSFQQWKDQPMEGAINALVLTLLSLIGIAYALLKIQRIQDFGPFTERSVNQGKHYRIIKASSLPKLPHSPALIAHLHLDATDPSKLASTTVSYSEKFIQMDNCKAYLFPHFQPISTRLAQYCRLYVELRTELFKLLEDYTWEHSEVILIQDGLMNCAYTMADLMFKELDAVAKQQDKSKEELFQKQDYYPRMIHTSLYDAYVLARKSSKWEKDDEGHIFLRSKRPPSSSYEGRFYENFNPQHVWNVLFNSYVKEFKKEVDVTKLERSLTIWLVPDTKENPFVHRGVHSLQY